MTIINSGSKFYIGTSTVMTTAATYAADTWVEVVGVQDFGESGDAYSEVKVATVANRRTAKFAGTTDGGDQSLVVLFDLADTGQNAMRAAIGDNAGFNFKVTFNDAPAGGTPTTFYYNGVILEGPVKMGDGNTALVQTFKVAINSEKIAVPKAAGT